MPDFFIIAGEASGDLHSSCLVKEIISICPESRFTGIGGKEMRGSGVMTLYDINDVNFIGFTSVMRNAFTIKKIMKSTVDSIREQNPDAVILVDFPGFNLRIAEQIKKFYSGKIVYYISPQVWAWHKSRIKKMQKIIDLLLVVFPFEVPFFRKEGMESVYVGHPLIKRIDSFLSRHQKKKTDRIIISLLPGSRRSEVESILPTLIDSAKLLTEKFNCEIRILCNPHIDKEFYLRFSGIENYKLIYTPHNLDANYESILNSDIVITKSGTSTLECALIGTPFLVVYKTGPVNYAIGKSLVDVKYISIVNILLDKPAVREFLQYDMTAENIFKEASRLLEDKKYSETQCSEFKELRHILGHEDASLNAAKQICSLVGISI